MLQVMRKSESIQTPVMSQALSKMPMAHLAMGTGGFQRTREPRAEDSLGDREGLLGTMCPIEVSF